MPGYTKLFGSILTSTVWQQSPATKVVWITLLALADQDGVVEASVPGLAHMAGVSVTEVEAALTKFQSPDPYSRSPEYEGRRIEPMEGGWRLLNHEKYRRKLSPEDRRERDRIRKERWREQQRSGCPTESGTKRDNRDESRVSRQAEAEAETDANEKQEYCVEPDGPAPASAVITLPLNDGSEYPISQEQLNQWSRLFPAVHVPQQLRNMKAWLEANSNRRKTKSAIKRFVVGWLTREQNDPTSNRSISHGSAIKESPRTQRNRASLEAVKERNSERLR